MLDLVPSLPENSRGRRFRALGHEVLAFSVAGPASLVQLFYAVCGASRKCATRAPRLEGCWPQLVIDRRATSCLPE